MCCRVWLSRSLGEKVKLPYDPSRLYLEATHAQHGPLRQLHPIPEQLHVHEFSFDGHPVTIHASTVNSAAECPGCGRSSCRVHGRYSRTCPALRNAVLKPETGKPEEGVLLAFAIREAARGALAGPQGRGCKATTRAPGTAVRRHPTPLPRRGGRALHLPMKLGISPRTVYRYKDLEEPPPRQTYTTRASVLDPYVPYLLSLLGRRLPRNGKQLLRERSAREATPTARGRSSALRQGCDVQRRPANRRLLVHRGPGKAP